ncbi:MAG: FtsQ-type POTRA domain-containing protein [Clostridiales bacterium]|nr:FtsQ-type POTRA domain-containing protein [Clostridiales bacterium]
MSNEYKKLKARHFIIIVLFSLIMIGFAIWFLFFCRVQTINIYNNVYTVSEDIEISSKIKIGNHLFGLDLDESKKGITENNNYIKSVKISRKIPSQIDIYVRERTPSFYTEHEGQKYVLSFDLYVLGKYEGETELVYGLKELVLPTMQTCELGKKIKLLDKDITEYEKILKTILDSEMGEKTTKIELKDKFDVEILYKNKYTVVFGSHKNLDKKIITCIKAVGHIEEKTPNVTGILYAYNPDEVSFQITGGSQN